MLTRNRISPVALGTVDCRSSKSRGASGAVKVSLRSRLKLHPTAVLTKLTNATTF